MNIKYIMHQLEVGSRGNYESDISRFLQVFNKRIPQGIGITIPNLIFIHNLRDLMSIEV